MWTYSSHAAGGLFSVPFLKKNFEMGWCFCFEFADLIWIWNLISTIRIGLEFLVACGFYIHMLQVVSLLDFISSFMKRYLVLLVFIIS